MTSFTLNQIGIIRSPYKEKFAVPRQPGLVEDGKGELLLFPPYDQPVTLRGLENFSHIWLIVLFHHTLTKGWRPTVRPPRLGGNTRMGIFATRSPFRPNPIGMSLVELKGIRIHHGQTILELGSFDLVDGTPVIDIKPYLPFAECHPHAKAGFAQDAPNVTMTVSFSEHAEQQLQQHTANYPHLRRFIHQVLEQDPRPAYRQGETTVREYAAWLLDFNVRWCVEGTKTKVLSLDTH